MVLLIGFLTALLEVRAVVLFSSLDEETGVQRSPVTCGQLHTVSGSRSGPGSLTAPRTLVDDQQASALPSVAVGVAEGIRARGAAAFPTPGAPGG